MELNHFVSRINPTFLNPAFFSLASYFLSIILSNCSAIFLYSSSDSLSILSYSSPSSDFTYSLAAYVLPVPGAPVSTICLLPFKICSYNPLPITLLYTIDIVFQICKQLSKTLTHTINSIINSLFVFFSYFVVSNWEAFS